MKCVVDVVVENGSRRSVRLDVARAAFLGPDGGAVVRAAAQYGRQGPVDDGIDATYELHEEVAPGQQAAFAIVVEFRPGGCNDSGTVTFHGWPTVDLTVLGRGHQVAADRDFRFHREGSTPGCRE